MLKLNHYTHIVPTGIDLNVRKFCKELVPEQIPFYVPVHPDATSEKMFCFKNVYHKAKRDGGKAVLGWDITNASNKFLEAEYHAVWLSPSGEYIDVTPPQIVNATRILFLVALEGVDIMDPKHMKLENRKFYL